MPFKINDPIMRWHIFLNLVVDWAYRRSWIDGKRKLNNLKD